MTRQSLSICWESFMTPSVFYCFVVIFHTHKTTNKRIKPAPSRPRLTPRRLPLRNKPQIYTSANIIIIVVVIIVSIITVYIRVHSLHTGRQADKQADRQTLRQTDRQTDRQTETYPGAVNDGENATHESDDEDEWQHYDVLQSTTHTQLNLDKNNSEHTSSSALMPHSHLWYSSTDSTILNMFSRLCSQRSIQVALALLSQRGRAVLRVCQ